MADSTHTPPSDRRVVLLDPAVVRLCETFVDNVPERTGLAVFLASEVLAGLQDERTQWFKSGWPIIDEHIGDVCTCTTCATDYATNQLRRRGSVDL